jgi:hypothetical protein
LRRRLCFALWKFYRVMVFKRYLILRIGPKCAQLAGVWSFVLLTAAASAQIAAPIESPLCATAVYQGAKASDAFSAIHALGNGRIIAGKRSSQASNRFLLSEDNGDTWEIIGCPDSTGAHTYFFGQSGSTVLSGTGDTGNACLMKSTDTGFTWTVALSSAQIRSLIGSGNARAVFSPVSLGNNRWIVNIKSFDTTTKVIMSSDNGQTWYVPTAQPGQNASAWARQMILTSDNVLLWPSCTTDTLYRSADFGVSWQAVTVPGAFLFQPLCDAGNGVYLCGEATTAPSAPIRLYRSLDQGLTWAPVASVNLERQSTTYWRDIIAVGRDLFASACCVEGTSNERHMQLFHSSDGGASWQSLGNPYEGPFGAMQAIYQMCATETSTVLAACQPDSTIIKWPVPHVAGHCPPTCYADCDQSTGEGNLDVFDFLCFQNSFVSSEPYACDCDTSTGPLVCDIFDFLCFQNAFVAGCP